MANREGAAVFWGDGVPACAASASDFLCFLLKILNLVFFFQKKKKKKLSLFAPPFSPLCGAFGPPSLNDAALRNKMKDIVPLPTLPPKRGPRPCFGLQEKEGRGPALAPQGATVTKQKRSSLPLLFLLRHFLALSFIPKKDDYFRYIIREKSALFYLRTKGKNLSFLFFVLSLSLSSLSFLSLIPSQSLLLHFSFTHGCTRRPRRLRSQTLRARRATRRRRVRALSCTAPSPRRRSRPTCTGIATSRGPRTSAPSSRSGCIAGARTCR